jgi:transposase
VFLACCTVDLRKGFDGLAAKAQQVIGADTFGGHLFLIRAKRGDYLKALYWDGSGLCLWLEKAHFLWPPIVDGAMTLTPAQFALLIEAMDWRRTAAPPLPAQPMLTRIIRRRLTAECGYRDSPARRKVWTAISRLDAVN